MGSIGCGVQSGFNVARPSNKSRDPPPPFSVATGGQGQITNTDPLEGSRGSEAVHGVKCLQLPPKLITEDVLTKGVATNGFTALCLVLAV